MMKRLPVGLPSSRLRDITIPQEVGDFFRNFFNGWVRGKSSSGFIEQFVDSEAISKQFSSTEERFFDPTNTATAFWMWKVRDHGLVTSLGHGERNTQDFETLTRIVADPTRLVNFESTDSALLPFEKEAKEPYSISPVGKEGGGQFMALARFRHAPHDVITIVAEKVNTSWRVTGFAWSIDQ